VSFIDVLLLLMKTGTVSSKKPQLLIPCIILCLTVIMFFFVIFHFTFLKASVNIYVIVKSMGPSIPNFVIQEELAFFSHFT